ncbi:glycosyltransferase [Protaetiibacter intestinalis]|uniref:Glycosyltransferase family 1 protein n=1 Tax=Protaetiibacter intestinalis TaxID=2419774 RepID=A0A387B8D1_9MICO|nr:glycosyltransferase [Protaetiibacter intestinalis]AYF97239.1 glycosyltransferase family 1 protein [Protaetiibacter intestinalis]
MRLPDLARASEIGARFGTRASIAFVVNTDRFFLTHRASWARAISAAGGSVTVIAADTGFADRIRELGFEFIPVEMGRESVSPLRASQVAWRLFQTLNKGAYDTVFLVATAAYTLGWFASLTMPSTRFIRVITGAGRALDGRSTLASLIVGSQLRFSARRRNVYSIFQLEQDLDRFLTRKMAVEPRSSVIPGTGIDTRLWNPAPAQRDPSRPQILFASRLFAEKGIGTYLAVARALADKAEFLVAGAPDLGVSTSVRPEDIAEWTGVVTYLGQSDDMLGLLQSADVLLFPSTHPEGTPRVLIEAAACGVAIVANDQPGSRAVVGDSAIFIDGVDEDDWIRATHEVLEHRELRHSLGRSARQYVVEHFDLAQTLTSVLEIAGVPLARKAPQ